MRHDSSPFKWRHYAPDVILLCVRWYCRCSLSYRDLEEIMKGRGLAVDHITTFRWVQRCAPEINKRMRPYLKMSGASYRLDETCVNLGGIEAVDMFREGQVKRLAGSDAPGQAKFVATLFLIGA